MEGSERLRERERCARIVEREAEGFQALAETARDEPQKHRMEHAASVCRLLAAAIREGRQS